MLFLFIIVHSILYCCSHLYRVFIQALLCVVKQTKHQKITEHTETNTLQVMPKGPFRDCVNDEDKKLKINNTVY